MKLNTIDKLCCPFDKHDLELRIVSKDTEENVLEGMFICGKCKRYYPIVKGVPIMNPDEYREPSLEQPLISNWKEKLQLENMKDFKLLDSN